MRTKILTIGYIFILIFIFKEAGFSNDDKLTLTVVPFQTIGEFENSDIYAYGLPEAIAHDLAQIPGITVVERLRLSSVLQEIKLSQAGLTNENIAAKVGNMLGAKTIIVGTVQKMNKFVRVHARLLNVVSGKIVFSIKVEKEIKAFKDVFSLENLVTKKIILQLGFKLSGKQLEKIGKEPTLSEDAFKFYSTGFRFFDSGDYENGLAHFNKAAEIDKDFDWAQKARIRAQQAFEELEREIEH